MKTLTARQEAKLNMYDVVIAACDANAAAVDSNTAFKTAIGEFKTLVGQIHAAAPSSAAVITGLAEDKKTQKKNLSRTTAVLAGQIFAYASKTKNVVLKEAADFSESDIYRIKDGEFAARCQTIHDLGAENKTELADYGVTDANLTALQTAVNAYAQTAPKPRTAIAERSTIKSNIKQLFAAADALLTEQTDKIAENLTKDFPDFVNTYKSARVIIDPKSNKKESGTGTPGGISTPT